MNVEGLTREKVASHLQKYRLYLRKISSGSNLQAGGSRLVSVGTEDSLAHIGGGYGVYRSLAGPASYPGYSSLPDHAGGVLGRLNAATGVASFRGISSSPLLQTSQFPNSFNAATVRFDPFPFSANQNASYLLQANPTITTMQMNNRLPLLTPPTPPTSSMMLNTREFDTQSSSNLGINMSLDSTAKVSWGKPIQPVIHPLSSPQNLLPIPSNNNVSAADITPPNAQTHNDNPLDFLFGTSSMGHPNAQIQDRPSSLNDFNIPAQGQQVQKPNYFMNLCNISNASSSLIPAVAPTQGENNNNITAVPSLSQLEDASPQSQQQNDAHKSFDDSTGQNSTESLDDIVGRFLKQGNGEAAAAPDLELDPFLMK
ncbi:two-component response regulator ARR12-like [Chenopodium quinoa]|uniref:two-component response regulator ARR12-like n=1 Tax=Chenopodium quinoa TaxID=63459 RepID=UPI000B78CBEE|nr:two-component response regulator ARR12-like [Chenopodium quinoa]